MDENVITLNQNEIMLARTIASFRQGLNRMANVKNHYYNGSDGFKNDLLGVCGEIAVARRFNIYLDLTFQPRSGGSDVTLRSGKTADVKTTDRADGRLVVPKWKEDGKKSDYYILVTGDLPTFTLRGWASADEVFSSVIDLGYGPCFGLMQDQLHSFNDENN